MVSLSSVFRVSGFARMDIGWTVWLCCSCRSFRLMADWTSFLFPALRTYEARDADWTDGAAVHYLDQVVVVWLGVHFIPPHFTFFAFFAIRFSQFSPFSNDFTIFPVFRNIYINKKVGAKFVITDSNWCIIFWTFLVALVKSIKEKKYLLVPRKNSA